MSTTMIPESFRQFWAGVEIESVDGTIQPFGRVAAPFQQRFYAVGPALAWTAGMTTAPPEKWWVWAQRHRGASKSSDAILAVLPVIVFAKTAKRIIVISTDQDAGRVLVDLCRKLVSLNPALNSVLKVDRWRISNIQTGSEIEIMASDAASLFGQLPDAIICDEVTHWRQSALWEAVASTLPKRKYMPIIILSNAGWLESWQRGVFESFHDVPHGHVDEMRETAPWISAAALDAQKRMLPPLAYRRLWSNEWVPGSGSALDADDIQACVTLDGPIYYRPEHHGCLMGLDLGLRRDHSALVTLLVDWRRFKVKVARVDRWIPTPGFTLSLDAIYHAIMERAEQYNAYALMYDKWQGEYLAERLTQSGIYCEAAGFQGAGASQMASTLLQAFRERAIELYEEESLLRDLRRMAIEESQFGYKLTAVRDEHGHCDAGFALALALPPAMSALANGRPDMPGDCVRTSAPRGMYNAPYWESLDTRQEPLSY